MQDISGSAPQQARFYRINGRSFHPSIWTEPSTLPTQRLRDEIYHAALTEEEGLFTMSSEHTPSSKPAVFYSRKQGDSRKNFNQLKYVCSQMYHETRGLLLQLNDLHFLAFPGYTMGKRHFRDFLTSCSPTMLSRLRHIILSSNRDLTFPETLGQLTNNDDLLTPTVLAFAGAHQDCTIDIRFSWRYDSNGFSSVEDCMGLGAIYQLYIRDRFSEHILSTGWKQFMASFISSSRSLVIPENVRFIPVVGNFNEEDFRVQCDQEDPSMTEKWVAQHHHWAENGF